MSVDILVSKALTRIGNVHPVVRQGAEEVIRRAYKEGIYVLFSDGYRSNAEQNKLYEQGRTRPGNIVTNARGGQSLHNYGLALDMFITNKSGTSATWPASELTKAAKIAKGIGFEWGGDWTSFKDMPHIQMTGGLSIAQLKAGQKPNISLKTGNTATKPKPDPKPQEPPKQSNKDNLGLVDWMKSKKMDSSFNNRKKLAGQYGINGYKGTAAQNTSLLTKLKTGGNKPETQPKPTVKGDQKTVSIVTYLNSIKVDSSYNNRAKLAKQYGINNYKGTAAQNTTLLNRLRGGAPSKPKQSISQMASKIINGKNVPTGHVARRKWLGIDDATYQKVRAEVNKRMR